MEAQDVKALGRWSAANESGGHLINSATTTGPDGVSEDVINFISNLPRDLRSGGFSAMNVAALEAIESSFEVVYIGPIWVRGRLHERVVSKARRMLKLGGSFPAYSRHRLADYARQVRVGSDSSAKLDFFHGFTPWVETAPRRPYVAWSDCSFSDYIGIYHNRAAFDPIDIRRIEHQEAEWLKRAARVLFTNKWAAERAIQRYGLSRASVRVVGIFGEMLLPEVDIYSGGHSFVFMSTNFLAKGGKEVLAALAKVQTHYPRARLTIVGAAPPSNAEINGVVYAGFLRKEDPFQLARLREILGTARALILPSRSDIAPLSIVEAAYFGCPSISTRAFAIPEVCLHEETGMLIDDPRDVNAIAAAMCRVLDDDVFYRGLRKRAWVCARAQHTRLKFSDNLRRILTSLEPILAT